VGLWREHPRFNQCLALFNTVGIVDAQDIDGRSADRSLSHKNCPVPTEMLFPNVPARIEKRRKNACLRIITGDVGAFGSIAMGTSKTRISHLVWAMVFHCANMINLVWQDAEFLGQLAILATPERSLFDQVPTNLGHRSPGLPRFLEGFPSFRLKNIDELAHPNVLVQNHPLFGRNHASLIFAKQLIDLLRRLTIEPDAQQRTCCLNVQILIEWENQVLKDI
jgi:hypothetical protein